MEPMRKPAAPIVEDGVYVRIVCEAFYDPLLKFVRRLRFAGGPAEELVHDLLARLPAPLGAKERGAPVLSYLKGCVGRTSLDSARKERRREGLREKPRPPAAIDPEERTIAAVEVERRLDRLERAESELPRARYLEDGTVEELARRLETTPGAVRKRVERACAKARRTASNGEARASDVAKPRARDTKGMKGRDERADRSPEA